MGNKVLCELFVLFIFTFSCFSCLVEIILECLKEVVLSYRNLQYIHSSDSTLIWVQTFCLFVYLYAQHYNKKKYSVISILLLIFLFVLKFFIETSTIYIICFYCIAIAIAIYLLIIYGEIKSSNKNK